jgi:hypothetical protein
VLGFSDLDLNVTLDYAFITDPPILADIGESYLGVNGAGLAINVSTAYNTTDEVLSLDMHSVTLALGEYPLAVFDGVSDFSEVVTGLVDTVGAIIRNRLVSIINAQLVTQKVNTLLNAVLALAPQDIDITHTEGEEFYLDGLLYTNLGWVNNDEAVYLDIPLMTVVQRNNSEPFSLTCATSLPDF